MNHTLKTLIGGARRANCFSVSGRSTCLTVIAAIVVITTSTSCGPRWVHDFDFGTQVARQQQSPMLVLFTDIMKNEHYEIMNKVFEAPAVKSLISPLSNVILSNTWTDVPDRFKVRGAFVCVLLTQDGQEIDRIRMWPLPTVDAFTSWLQSALTRLQPASMPAN